MNNTQIKKISYPPIYNFFIKKEKKAIKSVIETIYRIKYSSCLIWGGSTILRPKRTSNTDIDFWIITKSVSNLKKQLFQNFQQIEGVTFIFDSGYLPWLGELVSIFFFHNCTFSIDVGICNPNNFNLANPGPTPFFVWGKTSSIMKKLKIQRYETIDSQRMTKIMVNLLKIRKALKRGYIWNAIEYISRARRELMGLVCKQKKIKSIYYTRADRNIEDFISQNNRVGLSKLCPQYSAESVSRCVTELIQQCLNIQNQKQPEWHLWYELKRLQEWFLDFSKKLIKNEKTK